MNHYLHTDKSNICYISYFFEKVKSAFDSYKKENNELNKNWFKHKLDELMRDNNEITDCASILGELQIYGLLKNSFFEYGLKCQRAKKNKKMPDFTYEFNNNKANIEVATFLGTGKDEKKISKYENGYQEIHPYGKPQGDKKDNDLSELIKMLNGIKKDESQMNKEDINILAINLVNPIGEPIFKNLLKNRTNPYFIEKYSDINTIYMGGIWQSFYSKKDDSIFYSIGINDMIEENIYKMEYDSRFQRESLIDFAILNTYEGVVVYQNFNRNVKIPKNIYRCLMSLEYININNLWINWPKNNLKKRVNYHREIGKLYLKEAKKDKWYV